MDQHTFETYWHGDSTGPDERICNVAIDVCIDDRVDDGLVRFLAAAPPEFTHGFTGSGLPFPSASHAFEGTPNVGTVRVSSGGTVRLRLVLPNSFYNDAGTLHAPPTAYLSYSSGGTVRLVQVPLGQALPFRDLTYPVARTGPCFYAAPVQVKTQYEKILERAYPAMCAP